MWIPSESAISLAPDDWIFIGAFFILLAGEGPNLHRSNLFTTEIHFFPKLSSRDLGDIKREHIIDLPIVTELREKEVFYIAEDYHQDYYTNNPTKAYCSYVIDPKIAKIREKFQKYLKKG